jgi:tRNA-dihydrouridine synthase 1
MAEGTLPPPPRTIVVEGEAKARIRGRAFYESIGSPKYVVAPMVDQSEFVRHTTLPFC